MEKQVFELNVPQTNPMFEMIGYTPRTTFWSDFSIADWFGAEAIKETYERVFSEWSGYVIYMTELVMVLNHKIWEHHEKNGALAGVYNDLWERADSYCMYHFRGDDLRYYLSTTD